MYFLVLKYVPLKENGTKLYLNAPTKCSMMNFDICKKA